LEILLDTNVFLRWTTSDPLLKPRTRDLIANDRNRVLVSAVAVWEIVIKRRLKKLIFDGSPIAAITENRFFSIPIEPADAEAAGDLDWDHKDPFDRLMVAQAMRRGITLVTADHEMRNSPAAILWAG